MANALRPLPTSSHSDRTLWALDCGPGDCATQHIDAVTLTTSSNVFIRSATPREREASAATSIALLATGGVSSDGVSSVDLGSDGLRTLTVAAFSDDVELVVLRDTKLQRVEVQGSGTVAVDDHVLATGGNLYLSVAGSADIFAQSTDAMDLTSIYVINQGSENVQLSLGRVRVEQVTLSGVNSGDISLLTEEVDVSGVGDLHSSGAGTICWAASASATISSLKISGVSSGDIDVAAPGSCTTVKISSAGSGRIDTGSTRCSSASVSVFGSGQVVVQATDAISGTSVGSGSVKYVGSTPRSMGSSFPGGYSGYPFSSKPLAKPVGSSYSLPTCRKRDMPQIRQHGLVGDLVATPGVRTVSLPPVNTAPSIGHQSSPTMRATPPIDHQLSPTEGATSRIESPADEPQLPTPSADEPWEKVVHHYAALLPLAAVALIAALVLWRFNENQRRERRRRLEQQPLVSEHRPVYI